MMYSRIAGTGSYLPEKVLTNQDLERMVDTTDEWIVQRVGIHERHVVSEGDSVTSMAHAAALRAMESAGIDPNDIDLILVGTTTADNYFPSTACLIQHTLGITNLCPAFDLNAACAGFMYSMTVADQFIKSGAAKTVLVIGVDALSRVVDWTDRSTCVLFGDGAGAVILQSSETPGLLVSHIQSDGQYAGLLESKNYIWTQEPDVKIHMNGRSVFKQAVSKLDELVDKTVAMAGLDKSDIDWLIPHQANIRIIQATAKRLGLSMERVILTVESHGNTSAASIPLAFDHAVRSGQIQRGETVMMEAFGAGLAWGSVLVNY